MGTKPEMGDLSWLMLTMAPGILVCLILGSTLCVLQGFQWALPYKQLGHLGAGILANLCGRIFFSASCFS